jgi:predicted MPP superfamily phosphohydrolase
MRNIPLISGLIFLIIYWTLSFLFSLSLRKVLFKSSFRYKKSIIQLYTVSIFLQSAIFFTLFVYPFSTSTSSNYSLYFIYNSILLTDFFAKFPAAIAGAIQIAFSSIRMKTIIAYQGLIFSFSVLLIILWGFSFGSQSFHERNVELYYSQLPESFDGLRIAHLSDFHLGNYSTLNVFDNMVKACNSFSPDIIVFTGDMVNNFASETTGWELRFLQLDAEYKFAVLGNHDYGYYYKWPEEKLKKSNFEAIIDRFNDFGFVLLRNNSYPLIIGSDTIYIVGTENWGHPPFPQYADLNKALEHVPFDAFKILLSHDPAHWQRITQNDTDIPLTLSGHSHGMQWGIKMGGIEFSLVYFSRKFWGGLYEHGANRLYVNRGMGTIGIPIRVDMPAELTLLTLRKR